MKAAHLRRILLAAAIIAVTLFIFDTALAGTNIVDTNGWSSSNEALVLDSSGNPVIAYMDTNYDLKLAHCNDPACAGNDESIVTVESQGQLGYYAALELDANGYPVIAYYDHTPHVLKLAHCTDANCAGARTITVVDSDPNAWVGPLISFTLDANGYPVISYIETPSSGTYRLKLAHCHHVNCTSNTSIYMLTTTTNIRDTSLALDSNGYPVISYSDLSNDALKIFHCNDPNCVASDESLVTVANGSQGTLTLDANGYPVIVRVGHKS
jgi:hypothetical protein